MIGITASLRVCSEVLKRIFGVIAGVYSCSLKVNPGAISMNDEQLRTSHHLSNIRVYKDVSSSTRRAVKPQQYSLSCLFSQVTRSE